MTGAGPSFRIGHGFDLHRLEPDRPLIVGGKRLEHDRGAAAHSDGDVVYHAITDAMLGALGEKDLGESFLNADPQWKGADSSVFVRHAVLTMRGAGFRVGNLDVTVILERPKLRLHKADIRANLARLLGVDASQVNIKGKTHEQIGDIGQNLAIACHAVVLLVKD